MITAMSQDRSGLNGSIISCVMAKILSPSGAAKMAPFASPLSSSAMAVPPA